MRDMWIKNSGLVGEDSDHEGKNHNGFTSA
jgi:hypothetical protein